MLLRIDGHEIRPQPGQRLLDLVRLAGLDAPVFSKRPIAAKSPVTFSICNISPSGRLRRIPPWSGGPWPPAAARFAC